MFDRIRLGTLMFICLALPFVGCGSSSEVDSIVVTPQTVNFGAVGLTAQLTATATIDHGSHPATTEDVTNLVTWASDGPEVASVNSSGLVTSTGQGVIQITASMKGFTGVISASSTVTVTTTTTTGPPSSDIASIAIIPGTQTVQSPGETAQFIAIGTTVGGATENLTSTVAWTSSSNTIATISAKGVATAVGQGTATISAVATNLDKTVATGTATFTVTSGGTTSAEPITAVSIIPGSQSVAGPGGTAQFIAIATSGVTGLQLDVTSQVTWSSSSVGVGTITTSGLATGVGQGTTAITAIATNPDGTVVTGSAAFTVTGKAGAAPEPIASIAILPASLSVAAPGQTGQFIAIATSGLTGAQTNVTTSVAWTSSTAGVATIGAATGLATGVSQGTTAITAIATNPDGSVVTGAASFSVAGASTQQITSLSIIPGSQTVPMPLTPPASPTVFYVVIGTNAASGLQQNETSAVSWTSSNTAVATVNNGGGVTLVGQGSTTITAQYTNAATAGTPLNVVTATANLTVSGVAAEPLLSISILPGSESVGYPGQTSQLTAIGTFSEAPVTQNLTNSTTYPVTWTSSNPAVATVCTTGSALPCTAATDGLVTAVSQGAAAITAIASNPDGSVVTGAITFTVTNSGSEQVSSLTVVPSAISISATGQPGQLIAVATLTSGLQEDVTNSPQLGWTTSLPTVATVCTQASGTIPAYCATTPGQVQGVSAGTTNLTAEFTNPKSGSIASNVVTATGTITVTNTPAAEPLLSINLLPANAITYNLEGTGQFLAFGNFSTAPTIMDVTNGFYHSGFPNAACTAALAAANTAAIQADTPAPNAQCAFVPMSWTSVPFPFDFPINSAGAPGAYGGLITADASGTAQVYAVATNPDGTLVYSSNNGTFSCPYAPPTYGTITTISGGIVTVTTDYNDVLNPGTCNALTIGDGQLSTLTVFNASISSTGLNTTNWLLTAPSATGTPNVIHCGGATEQAAPGGSVCEATYPNGSIVTITAPAESGVNFGGWSAACYSPFTPNPNPSTAAGPNSCTVVVGGACTLNVQTETYICTNTANVAVGAIFN